MRILLTIRLPLKLEKYFKSGVNHGLDEPEELVISENKEALKDLCHVSKELKRQLKGAPTGQRQEF